MKKFLSILLTLLTLFSVVGCAPSGTSEPPEKPVYQDLGDIKCMGFVCPVPNDGALDDYIAAGFNAYLLDQSYGATNSDEFKAVFDICQRKGLEVYIRTYDHLNTPEYPYYGTDRRHYDDFDFNVDDYPAITGAYLWDEPNVGLFNMLHDKFVPWWNENYADTDTFMINLYPSYANTNLGVAPEDYVNGSPFEGYIKKYVDTVLSKVNGKKVLSFDHYPLDQDLSRGGEYISASWLSDLAIVADYAYSLEDCKFNAYIQGYGSDSKKHPTSKGDISIQLYTCLAMGAESFDFYRYLGGGSEMGLINQNEKSPMYFYVKDALADLHFMDGVFLNFTWKGAKTFIGTENSDGRNNAFEMISRYELASLPGVKNVTVRHDTVIGHFVDAENRNGYLAVNYNLPYYNKIDTVSMSLDGDYKKAIVYIEGEELNLDVVDGKLNFTLNPGQGAFIIPY